MIVLMRAMMVDCIIIIIIIIRYIFNVLQKPTVLEFSLNNLCFELEPFVMSCSTANSARLRDCTVQTGVGSALLFETRQGIGFSWRQ